MKQKEFEDKLINMILDGNEEYMVKLREQYRNAKIESGDFTGVGFFTEYKVDEKYKIKDERYINLEFGDVEIDYNGIKDAFGEVLFIRDGLISTLECYTLVLDEWSTDYENFELKK